MDEHLEYELIVCGHSLRGGATYFINLLMHNEELVTSRPQNFRSFAYASPPVVATELLNNQKEWTKSCINVMNRYYAVPFLCAAIPYVIIWR